MMIHGRAQYGALRLSTKRQSTVSPAMAGTATIATAAAEQRPGDGPHCKPSAEAQKRVYMYSCEIRQLGIGETLFLPLLILLGKLFLIMLLRLT